MSIAYAAGFLFLSYVLGSIPTGYWVGKAVKGIDIRTVGSGSTGATNVLRSCGKGPALFVFLFDIAKGFAPCFVGALLEESLWSTLPVYIPHLIPVLAGLLSVIGHSKSIFLGFSGGKSAATALGTLYGLNWVGATGTFILWVTIVAVTRFVSLASMAAALLCTLFMWWGGAPPAVLFYSFGTGLYVVVRHKSNIKRLMEGTEARIGEKAKELKPAEGANLTEPSNTEANSGEGKDNVIT